MKIFSMKEKLGSLPSVGFVPSISSQKYNEVLEYNKVSDISEIALKLELDYTNVFSVISLSSSRSDIDIQCNGYIGSSCGGCGGECSSSAILISEHMN